MHWPHLLPLAPPFTPCANHLLPELASSQYFAMSTMITAPMKPRAGHQRHLAMPADPMHLSRNRARQTPLTNWKIPVGSASCHLLPPFKPKITAALAPVSPSQFLSPGVSPHPSHPLQTPDWSSPSPKRRPHGEPVVPPWVIAASLPRPIFVTKNHPGELPLPHRCLCSPYLPPLPLQHLEVASSPRFHFATHLPQPAKCVRSAPYSSVLSLLPSLLSAPSLCVLCV